MFTTTERETFARQGLIKRENFLPVEKVDAARQVIFHQLAQAGLRRNGGWALDKARPATELTAGMALVNPWTIIPRSWRWPVKKRPPPPARWLTVVRSSPWAGIPGCSSLPNATTWTLPHQHWHLDMPRLPAGGVPGVQIFACLDTVEPGGGGTLAVTGSHRLLNERVRISSGDLRKRLMKERYFAELMSNKRDDRLRFLREVGHMGNVALQVVEMTGEAGDVYFMDLRVLHTVAPHVNPTLSPGIVTDCTPWKISALSVIRKYANCDSS